MQRLANAGYDITIDAYLSLSDDSHERIASWRWNHPPHPSAYPDAVADKTFVMHVYNERGHYVGDVPTAWLLFNRGIAPECPTWSNVCCIGWCEREQKWYGWSHRAMHGFEIGDVVHEGDCTATSGWIEGAISPVSGELLNKSLPVGFTARTLADCKRMAEAYAESVS
jgi:hypothetical protein